MSTHRAADASRGTSERWPGRSEFTTFATCGESRLVPRTSVEACVRNPVEKQTVSPGLVLYFNERWSYAQLLELSSRVAAGLQKLGFKPGQLAGLHCDATPNIVFAFYGTVLTGGSMVFAKSSLTE
ncbi:hypothetical protein HPB47_016433, partial [Ixodes persulcatus]